MKSRIVSRSALLGIALVGTAIAQSVPLITMDRAMTLEQLRTTGVDGLTAVQRAALDRWLSEYTMKVFQLTHGSDRPTSLGPRRYAGSSGGHWIKSRANGGAMITLEDGSIWEINPLDRIDAALWLPISNVTILTASSPIGDYKYMLVNTDDGETALAKYLGRQ